MSPGSAGRPLADGRLKTSAQAANPSLTKFTPRNWEIVAALQAVADEIGRPMAQVAINWVANRPAVSSVLLGATRAAQLDEALPALDFDIPAELEERLDTASRIAPAFPYAFIDAMGPRMHGAARMEAKPPRYGESLGRRRGGWR